MKLIGRKVRPLSTGASADELVASMHRPRPLLDLVKEQWNHPVELEPYAGPNIAKIPADFQTSTTATTPQGKLILVTAMSPTKFGEGKTCTSVGLTDALRRIGKRATVCLREPSLGPVFGMKGGAAGGGKSQLVPMEKINLHFTGDIHAVSASNNLLSAMMDNALHFNTTSLDQRQIMFKRVLDMNDRSLRQLVIGLGGKTEGVPRQDGFDITVASEVMAILCLSSSLTELQTKLGNILLGRNSKGEYVRAKDVQANGAMTALLTEAFRPNVVQSLEHTLALVHGGPFANIAHGCSSVVATQMGLKLADYVVTEAGFGADLGAEKFLHIKCRQHGLQPHCAVVVATVRALKFHGQDKVVEGMANLFQHVENLQKFNLNVVVALNQFPLDTREEMDLVVDMCKQRGIPAVVANHWAEGSAGAEDLAKLVANTPASRPLKFMYELEDSLERKLHQVATEIYRAKHLEFSPTAKKKLQEIQSEFGHLPVCVAKTQYSFSDNAELLNAPQNHVLHVQDLKVSAGAGFVVALTGSVMTMPGLPRSPAATRIGVSDTGKIFGLF